jgi:hypothetical protein
MSESQRRLYVAYGSNLNLKQMACRCPTAKVAGTAVMRNWRLVFNGVATIERYYGGKVPVLVWELQPEMKQPSTVTKAGPACIARKRCGLL